MKTEYRILWIDDLPTSVRGDVRNIKRFLKTKEVTLNLKQIKVTAGNNVIENDEFLDFFNSDELDFLLIDLNMPDINGVEVISYIRSTLGDYYTPIVFYTSDASENLPELIQKENNGVGIEKYLDGIFFCHRDDISNKVINLMTSKLNREHKIKAVRGMLIESVSDLDVEIIEGLRNSFEHIESGRKATILAKIKQKFGSKKATSEQTVNDLSDASYEDAINYILDDLRKTNQHFRAEILRDILKYTNGATEQGTILSTFYNPKPDKLSLNCFRNNYAHKTAAELEGIHSGENNLFIKAEVRKHKKNMSEIISRNAQNE
ncbi:MAG: response regulator [Gammaproteobacteria bacterium]